MSKRRMVNAAVFSMLLFLVLGSMPPAMAGEEAWPNRSINLVVNMAPGGGTDISARIAAKYLSEELGQPVAVSNVKGAGGSLGAKTVLNSAPDGYTILYSGDDLPTNKALGISDTDHDDFEIAGKLYDVELISVIANKKYKSLEDVKKAALANPGKVSFAIEIANAVHLTALVMEEKLGLQLNLVDAGSLNERLPLLLSGQLDMTYAPVGVVKDYIESGAINCIGLLQNERSPFRPEIPTMKEQGFDLAVTRYFIFYFPKGTAPEIVARMARALEKVAQNPEFKKQADAMYFRLNFAGGDQARRDLDATKTLVGEYRDMLLGKR